MNESTTKQFTDFQTRLEKLEAAVFGRGSSEANMEVRAKKLSPKEFLMGKGIKADTQKLLALTYYLEHMSGMTSFNISDIEATFRGAKEKLPANINDAVNKNIARGFLMEAEEKKDSKKAWCLTATGERYVEEEFIK